MDNLVLFNQDSFKNILIVEDDASALRALSFLLSSVSNVTGVCSGNKAIELLKNQKFDLIVSDYRMNDGDGLDVVKFVSVNTPEVPVVLITSHGHKDLIIKMLNFHVFGFVEKPYSNQEVLAVVNKALTKKLTDDTNRSFAEIGQKTSELVHDISNPLMIIDIKTEALKNKASSENDEDLLAHAAQVEKNTNRIKSLVSAAKDILKKKASQNKPKHETFKLEDLLTDLRNACIHKAVENKVPVVITPEQNVSVYGNREEILRAFINLVNNAIEAVATLDEKWVSINVYTKNKNLEFVITDSGKGIPESLQDKIFNPLFTTKESGTGLGLKIVLDIIKNHGGSFQINKKSANTQFVVSLPKA